MTRRISIILTVALLLPLAACVQENLSDAPLVQKTALEGKAVNTSENALEGSLVILLDEISAAKLSNGESVPALADACAQTGASLDRAFNVTGTDRERQHRLDRWYVLTFSRQTSVTEVAEVFAALSEVSVIQYNTKVERDFDSEATEWTEGTHTLAPELPFNDPKLIDQWHYINYGDYSVAQSVREGADINVRNAWRLSTGDPAIIVAVCDEGVKYDHPDLAANMWVNEAEKNGVEGVDDDGNGYVDDIHGYNFLSTYNVSTEEGVLMPVSWDHDGDSGHGTHVAGTIAAVNNNGIGVSGVAGGDGSADSGVRIMTCQLFSGNASGGTLNRAQAYKYAADMGPAYFSVRSDRMREASFRTRTSAVCTALRRMHLTIS